MLGRNRSPALSAPHPANERIVPVQRSPIPFVKQLPQSIDAPGVSERSESLTQEQKDLALEERFTQRHIDKTADKESRDYLPLFEKLGLNREQGLELIEDLKRLHWGSARVNTSVIKLVEARSEYDKKVKSMLGSESYEKYRAFESGKKASTELEVMARYLGDRNQTLTSATAQNILAALEKHP